MLAATALRQIFSNLRVTPALLAPAQTTTVQNRYIRIKEIPTPKPGGGKQYRRLVHWPEDGVYTVKPLDTTNLAGRDPVTGRVVAKGIGGGIKYKYHWVQYVRDGPATGPALEEKVIEVFRCMHRTANIALVAAGSELKYILATVNMKAGDILKTSRFIPKIPVRANDGDAYPLGALPVGTMVHCVERFPDQGFHMIRAAGTFGTVDRKFEGHVVVRMPNKEEFGFKETCMATVGRLSNVAHQDTHVGSAQRNRELGNRPRSGLWQRKSGRHGRKIRKLPPMRIMQAPKQPPLSPIVFSLPEFKYH